MKQYEAITYFIYKNCYLIIADKVNTRFNVKQIKSM